MLCLKLQRSPCCHFISNAKPILKMSNARKMHLYSDDLYNLTLFWSCCRQSLRPGGGRSSSHDWTELCRVIVRITSASH